MIVAERFPRMGGDGSMESKPIKGRRPRGAGAGGGIVSLPDPKREWEEVLVKPRAVPVPLGVVV